MIAITDSHHHIWRQADLPWLQGPMVPRIFGPYEPIRRDYTITEYLAEVAATGVDRSVYIQANWPKHKAVEEVAFVQSVAGIHGWPHAIIGYADLLADDAAITLNAQAKHLLMRGIRMQLHWHVNPLYCFAPSPDIMNQALFRKNMALLAGHGWSFDLQVFTGQMADAARLAADFPQTVFILQHAGMLEDLSATGRNAWREGMQRLAQQPNIVSKLSGLGTFIHRNDAQHIAEIVETTVEIFSTGRCLFGSNFPIEKLWTGYAELVAAHRKALAYLPLPDQVAILDGNARRIYRI